MRFSSRPEPPFYPLFPVATTQYLVLLRFSIFSIAMTPCSNGIVHLLRRLLILPFSTQISMDKRFLKFGDNDKQPDQKEEVT